ncbi:MAG: hypothetical protein K0R38_7194, partial [Polyangiaceae bacterium]|nr:hypothetical protein [Polyangiaceae bacterium]
MKRALRFLLLPLLSTTAFAADAGAPIVRAGQESADAAAVQRAFGRVPAFQLQALGADD